MSNTTKDLVFVISGGRTGTQFLGDRLSAAITDSYSVHDPDILSVYVKRVAARIKVFGLWNMTIGKALGRTGVRSIGQRLITGEIDRSTALSRIHNLRSHYHESIRESLVIESNSQWLYVCDEIATIWPHARVIVVVRDPRTWIRSWLNKGIRWRPYDPVRLFPPGRLTPRETGDSAWIRRWRSFDTLGKLAWEWRFVYGRLQAHVERNPNARLFRFEDLFEADNDNAMHQLVSFSASHPMRQYRFTVPEEFRTNIQNASHGSYPDWREWAPEQAKLVDDLCGLLMKRFGYGNEESWKQKLEGI